MPVVPKSVSDWPAPVVDSFKHCQETAADSVPDPARL